jgi:hypothetical protein
VQNPGFEDPTNIADPPTSWTAVGSSLERNTDANSGSYSGYVYAEDSYYTQTVIISPIAAYKFSVYLKASDATAKAVLMIQDSNHVNLVAPLVLSTTNSAWTKKVNLSAHVEYRVLRSHYAGSGGFRSFSPGLFR